LWLYLEGLKPGEGTYTSFSPKTPTPKQNKQKKEKKPKKKKKKKKKKTKTHNQKQPTCRERSLMGDNELNTKDLLR